MASPAQVPGYNPNQSASPWSREASSPAVYHYPAVTEYVPPVAQSPYQNHRQPAYHEQRPVAQQYQAPAYYNQYPAVPPQAPQETVASQPSSDKKNRNILLGLTATTAAVATLGAGLLGIKAFAHESNDTPARNETSTSMSMDGAHTPEQMEQMSYDLFVGLPRSEQLDFVAPILNESAQEDAESYREYLKSEGNYTVFTDDDGETTRTIAEPSVDNTPQEIWDQTTVAYYHVWETFHNGDIELAKKLASGIAPVGTREYNDIITYLDTSGMNAKPLSSAGYAEFAKEVTTTGVYHDVSAQGMPLIEFTKTSAFRESDKVYAVLRLEEGTTDDSARWSLVKTVKTQ